MPADHVKDTFENDGRNLSIQIVDCFILEVFVHFSFIYTFPTFFQGYGMLRGIVY